MEKKQEFATQSRVVDSDVVVLGAGASGIAAAIAAARAGLRTILVDAGPMPGGELISGMAVDGALNARGEWILGGVGRDVFAECQRLGGYVGPLNDHRLIWYVCLDPEVMKLAVAGLLAQGGREAPAAHGGDPCRRRRRPGGRPARAQQGRPQRPARARSSSTARAMPTSSPLPAARSCRAGRAASCSRCR